MIEVGQIGTVLASAYKEAKMTALEAQKSAVASSDAITADITSLQEYVVLIDEANTGKNYDAPQA